MDEKTRMGWDRIGDNFPVIVRYYGGHCKEQVREISFRNGTGILDAALQQKEWDIRLVDVTFFFFYSRLQCISHNWQSTFHGQLGHRNTPVLRF